MRQIKNELIIFAGLVSLFSCCFLDTYYLWQERKFRDFYAEVIKEQSTIKDFDFSSFKDYQAGFISYIKTLSSYSILLFYGLIAVCIFILWWVL